MENLKKKLNEGWLRVISLYLILFLCVIIMYPFWSAILMGGLFSLAFSSVFKRIRKMGLSKNMALNSLMVALLILVIAPTLSFFMRGSKLVTLYFKDQAFLDQIKDTQAKLIFYFNDLAPVFGLSSDDLSSYLHQFSEKITAYLVVQLGSIVTQLPGLALMSIVMLTSLYVFLKHEEDVKNLFDDYFGMQSEERIQLIKVFQTSSQMVFFSNVLVGLVQALLVCLGSVFFGVGDWFLVLFITFVASFVPLIGAAPIAFSLTIYAFLSGQSTAAIGLLIVSVVSGVIDNALRPYLSARGQIQVPALVNILSVIGGVTMLGMKGLFLGPFIASIAYGALPILFKSKETSTSDF